MTSERVEHFELPWHLVPEDFPSIDAIIKTVTATGQLPNLALRVVDFLSPTGPVLHVILSSSVTEPTCSVDAELFAPTGSTSPLTSQEYRSKFNWTKGYDFVWVLTSVSPDRSFRCILSLDRTDPIAATHHLALMFYVLCASHLREYVGPQRKDDSLTPSQAIEFLLPSYDEKTDRLVLHEKHGSVGYTGELKLILPNGEEWNSNRYKALGDIPLKEIERIRVFVDRTEFSIRSDSETDVMVRRFVITRSVSRCYGPSTYVAWLMLQGKFGLVAVDPRAPADLLIELVPTGPVTIGSMNCIPPPRDHFADAFWRYGRIVHARFPPDQWLYGSTDATASVTMDVDYFYHRVRQCRGTIERLRRLVISMSNLGYVILDQCTLTSDGFIRYMPSSDPSSHLNLKFDPKSELAHDIRSEAVSIARKPQVQAIASLFVPIFNAPTTWHGKYFNASLKVTDALHGERRFNFVDLKAKHGWNIGSLLGYRNVPFHVQGLDDFLFPIQLAAGDLVKRLDWANPAISGKNRTDSCPLKTLKEHSVGLLVTLNLERECTIVRKFRTDQVPFISCGHVVNCSNTEDFGHVTEMDVRSLTDHLDPNPFRLGDGTLFFRFDPSKWYCHSIEHAFGRPVRECWIYGDSVVTYKFPEDQSKTME